MRRGNYLDKLKEKIILWLLKKIMDRRHYAYTLTDGTKVVRMTAEFCNWTYNKNYEAWKNRKQT